MNYSTLALQLLRIGVSGIFIMHGVTRIANGTVDDFGGFLDAKGFIVGFVIAWAITIFEIIGSSLLIAGKYIQPIALVFVAHQVMALILVHAKNGWFVVGGGSGGMEYSVLLILSLLVIATGKK